MNGWMNKNTSAYWFIYKKKETDIDCARLRTSPIYIVCEIIIIINEIS